MTFFIWLLPVLFFFYEFLLQVSPNVMVHSLMRDFSVHASAIGLLGTIYFIGYSIMQIPVGILLDHYGVKKVLSIAVSLCAISCFIFATTHNFFIAQFARLLLGAASAFAVVSSLEITGRWFGPRRFAFLAGIVVGLGMLGAVFGGAPMAFFVHKLGWRHAIFIFGVIGLVLAGLIFLIVKDRPAKESFTSSSVEHASILSGIAYIIRQKQSWLVSIYAAFMYAPTVVICGLWGATYLMKLYPITKSAAAGIVSMIYIGFAIGCPTIGWFSSRFKNRKPTVVACSILSAISLTLALYMPGLSRFSLILLFLSFGYFSSSFLLGYSMIREMTPERYGATSLAFINMLNMIGAIVAPALIGMLLDANWHGRIINGVRSYSIHTFQIAMGSLPILTFVGVAFLVFVKEVSKK